MYVFAFTLFKRVAIEFASGIEENPLVVSWLVEPSQTTTTFNTDEANSTVITFFFFNTKLTLALTFACIFYE